MLLIELSLDRAWVAQGFLSLTLALKKPKALTLTLALKKYQ